MAMWRPAQKAQGKGGAGSLGFQRFFGWAFGGRWAAGPLGAWADLVTWAGSFQLASGLRAGSSWLDKMPS